MRARACRRDELLEQIVDTLLTDGISDLSLRPLAKSVGTSARLLIYHFGSKEELLTEALERVRQRIDASVVSLAKKEHPASLEEFLLLFWRWALRKTNRRYFLLLFEVSGLAMHHRDKFPPHFHGAGITRWVGLFERNFDQLSSRGEAPPGTSTFVIAALNGLLHDFFATGDRRRTTNALHCLIRAVTVRPAISAHAGNGTGRIRSVATNS